MFIFFPYWLVLPAFGQRLRNSEVVGKNGNKLEKMYFNSVNCSNISLPLLSTYKSPLNDDNDKEAFYFRSLAYSLVMSHSVR